MPARLLAFALLALPLTAAAEPIRVTGQILDPGANTQVEIFPAWEDQASAARRLEAGAELKPLASVRPDAQGRFEIRAPDQGIFRLVVRSEGRVHMAHPLVPLVEDTDLPSVILTAPEMKDTWFPQGSEESADWGPVDLGDSGQARVRVEVRDGSDKPVPGAVIRRGGQALARTGPDGWTEVAILAKDRSLTVEGRDGWRARLERPAAGKTAIIRLQPPRTVTGRVIDSVSKRPLAGALLWIGRPPASPAVRAGDDGFFQIAIPAGEDPFLEAAAPGYIPFTARVVKPGEREVLALEPSATLLGTVVDSAGNPLSGVRIQADPPRDRVFPSQRIETWSGGDGRFRVAGLQPSGTYWLKAGHERFAPAEVTAPTAPAGKPSQPIRIVMGAGQTASGRVVDHKGEPVAGVRLVLFMMTGDGAMGVSRDDGKFEIPNLRSGRYNLIIHPLEGPTLQRPEVEIPPGTPVVDLGDVELPGGGGIEGRVVDAQGAPVAGATIEAWPSFTEGQGMGFVPLDTLRQIQTAADGSFSVPGLQHGDHFDLTVRHSKYVEVTVPGIEAPTVEPVRIVLRPGRSVAGQVVGPEGEPVAAASLNAMEETQIGNSTSYSGRSLAMTDDEGRFLAERVPPGLLTLQVQAEGYLSRVVEGLLLPEDQDLKNLKIVLERGVQLEVQVLSAEGEPVPDTMVRADPESADAGSKHPYEHRGAGCSTDTRGRCRIAVPGAGVYTLRVMSQVTAATARVEAAGGITPVEIRLPAGVEVSGRVIGEDGVPARMAFVEVESEAGNFGAPAQPDGSFRFTGIADGQYQLSASNPFVEGSRVTLEVVVAGQSVRDLELRFQKDGGGAVLTGRVLGLEPEERRNLSVSAVPSSTGDPHVRSGQINAQGEYRIPGLEAGDWKIQAYTMTGRRAEADLHIEPGVRNASLDLEFPPRGPRISGRVLLDGAPLPGALVQHWRGSEADGQAMTGYDGSFALDVQEQGAVTLLIGGPQGIGASRTLSLTEDAEITVDIRTGRLRGIVLGPDGSPVAGAAVRVEGWSPELQVPFAGLTLRSGPDGAFEAPRLATGTVRITVQAPGFAASETLTEVPLGGEGMVEIRLGSLNER